MKTYWIYMCDLNHVWIRFKDEDAPIDPGEDICPFAKEHARQLQIGREAVTLQKERMLNYVEVILRPAARYVDDNRIAHEYEYFLVVRNPHSGEERMTQRSYTWEAGKQLMDRFRNKTFEQASELLDAIEN